MVPIRFEDRYSIMKWRNEQLYHLRQNKLLTKKDQDQYFRTVVASLFENTQPSQILFSYLENNICIGYGGIVHIDWISRNAELSFLLKSSIEEKLFEFHYTTFLKLITRIAFQELDLHKIFTFAFDVRPQLYPILEKNGFELEARLKEHILYGDVYVDAVLHRLINPKHQHF
jgi:RimJ/RimL family protein N-acetyltransferase